MERDRKRKILRAVGTAITLVLAVAVGLFALFSGAGQGIAANAPNALPWVLLGLMGLLARKREMAGGILLALTGLAAAFFFDLFTRDSWPGLFVITLPLLAAGACFIASALLKQR